MKNADADETVQDVSEKARSRPWFAALWFRIVVALVVVLIGVALIWYYREVLSLKYLASQESELRAYQANHPLAVYGVATLVYLVASVFGLPIMATTVILFGWLFGFLPALVLASFTSTAGATVAFLGSRYFFRGWVERWFGGTLRKFEQELHEEGPFYVFLTRLIPQIPFSLVNVIMGLTPIRLRTFWLASQLGMLPGLIIYAWVGTSLPNLQTIAKEGISSVVSWQLIGGMAAMGIVPLAIRGVMKWRSRNKEAARSEATS